MASGIGCASQRLITWLPLPACHVWSPAPGKEQLQPLRARSNPVRFPHGQTIFGNYEILSKIVPCINRRKVLRRPGVTLADMVVDFPVAAPALLHGYGFVVLPECQFFDTSVVPSLSAGRAAPGSGGKSSLRILLGGAPG